MLHDSDISRYKRTAKAGEDMGRNKTSPAEKRHKSPQPAPEQPPKRSKSQKDRPGTVEGLALAIREDRLDLRTRESQQLVALRDAIDANPLEVARGAARDMLAMNLTISAALVRQLTMADTQLIDEEGSVHQLVGRTWPELQRSILSGITTLLRLESILNPQPAKAGGKAGADDPDESSPPSISDIILSLNDS